MNFRLVDGSWQHHFDEAARCGGQQLRLICPFIKRATMSRLLSKCRPQRIQVITRFNLPDFCDGVSDTSALRLLLTAGAEIRGVKALHAKLYLFGRRSIVTSANLTNAALTRNHEFGFVADDDAIVARCDAYFAELWGRAGKDLTRERIDKWDVEIETVRLSGGRPSATSGLRDDGVVAKLQPPPRLTPPIVAEAGQAFVKFFGESHSRAHRSMAVMDEVRGSGCHWSCTYPRGKRPRAPQDGSVMFMGRLVGDPADTLIYGRAIGIHHVPGRDDATVEDIQLRSWREDWPHYIRVHHAEFLAGTLANGISLSALMRTLGSDSFTSTQRHAASGAGNTDPRQAYRQQAAVQLSPQATAWLNTELDKAFAKCGHMTRAELETLDWPPQPVSGQ